MTETNALTVFSELEVPAAVGNRILDMVPDFTELSRDEQLQYVEFFLSQAENTTENVKSRFPQITVKHAGANAIELPVALGQDTPALVREFEGILLYQYLTKAYWAQKYGQGRSGPPDCASLDALKPYTSEDRRVSESCISCPMNRFGTAKRDDGTSSRGKACRDQKRVILALDDHELPCRLSCSAANIKALDGYLNDLRDQGSPIGTVITKIRAVGQTSADGADFTGLEFSTVRPVTPEELRNVMKMKAAYQDDFRMGAIEADEGRDDGPEPDPEERAQAARSQKAADVM